jgi:hypothetical protein
VTGRTGVIRTLDGVERTERPQSAACREQNPLDSRLLTRDVVRAGLFYTPRATFDRTIVTQIKTLPGASLDNLVILELTTHVAATLLRRAALGRTRAQKRYQREHADYRANPSRIKHYCRRHLHPLRYQSHFVLTTLPGASRGEQEIPHNIVLPTQPELRSDLSTESFSAARSPGGQSSYPRRTRNCVIQPAQTILHALQDNRRRPVI